MVVILSVITHMLRANCRLRQTNVSTSAGRGNVVGMGCGQVKSCVTLYQLMPTGDSPTTKLFCTCFSLPVICDICLCCYL